MESLKKFAALIGILLGITGQLISLLLAFKNNFTIAVGACFAIAFLITVTCLVKVVVSKVPSRVGEPSQSVPHYSKGWRRTAAVILVTLPLAITSTIVVWKYGAKPTGGFLVLVADFDGPNPKSYRVSEIIVEKIRLAVGPYKDIEVKSIGRTVTAQQGSPEAIRIANENNAAMILWGWYGSTSEAAIATVHFEIISPREMARLPSSSTMTSPVSELNRFTLQTHLAQGYSYVSLIAAALVRFEKQDYAGALDRFDAAEKAAHVDDPALLDATYLYLHRGAAYIELSKPDAALNDLNRCIARSPTLAPCFVDRAVALHDLGRLDDAKRDADVALGLGPCGCEAVAYNTRGVIIEELGKPDRKSALQAAFADFNKALQLNPRLSWAYNNRGWIYYLWDDFGDALKDYDEAIKYGSIAALENRRILRYATGEFEEVVSDYTAALTRDPDNPSFYAQRCLAHAALGHIAPANSDCAQAIRMNPKDAHLYDTSGVAHTELGDFEHARKDFNTAVSLDSGFARSYFDRGTMYMRLQNYDSAIEDFSTAIRLDADFGEAYASRGEAYQKIGKDHLAFRDFASATHHGMHFIVQSWKMLDKDENPKLKRPLGHP